MVTLVHAFFFTKDDAHKVKAHHHISPPPHPTSKGIQWRNCPRRCPRDPTRHGARAVKAQDLGRWWAIVSGEHEPLLIPEVDELWPI